MNEFHAHAKSVDKLLYFGSFEKRIKRDEFLIKFRHLLKTFIIHRHSGPVFRCWADKFIN